MRTKSWPHAVLAIALVTAADAAAYTVSGTVMDEEGRPVKDAQVWLVDGLTVLSAQTDASGTFSFTRQASGEVDLVAFVPGMAIGGARALLVEDVSVELDLAPAIETRLRTVDPRLRPIAGARLLRLRINDHFNAPVALLSSEGLPSVRSDAEGNLVIPFLAAGDYARIEIDHRNFAREILPTLPAGTSIDAVLPFGERVRGRVLTPDGQGAAGANVTIFQTIGGRARSVGDAVTEAEGFYSLVAPPGEYFITARLATYGVPQPIALAVAIDTEAVAPDLILSATALVSGAALDRTGAPVAGVRLRYVQDRIVLAETVTGRTGQYSIRANLGDGKLRFEPPKGRALAGPSEIDLSVGSGQPLVLPAITVADLPVLEGTVTAGGGEPLDRVLVSTVNLGPNLYVRPAADGRFAIQLDQFPPDGMLSLRAEHADRFLRAETEVHVFDGPAPMLALGPFQPDASPAADGYPNNLKALVGGPAPELACDSWFNVNEGETVSIAALRGKVVVLTFWGSFDQSPRARGLMNEIERWHELYADGDVAFAGVHESTTAPEIIQAALAEWKITFANGRDQDSFETFDRYSINFIPQTVLIDREGIVRYYDIENRLGELIKDLRRR